MNAEGISVFETLITILATFLYICLKDLKVYRNWFKYLFLGGVDMGSVDECIQTYSYIHTYEIDRSFIG